MSKGMVYVVLSVGTLIGGWIPTLWGAAAFSGWSILGSTVGGMIAVFFIWQNR